MYKANINPNVIIEVKEYIELKEKRDGVGG